MSEASELIYDEVWARSEAARLTDEQIIKFIYAPNSDNLTKAIRSRLANRIEAVERERDGLRDALTHANHMQRVAQDARDAAEAREARLSEALRNLAHEMRFMLRANPKKEAGLYRQRLDEADAALSGSNPVWREPDGWKLVPVEPSRAHLERLASLWGYTLEETADIYAAFLDALPAAPQQGGE